jgi:mannose-1-phosphate guanylyltransferase
VSLYAVILCGGRGERFWPKSRRRLPKQFIKMVGDRSLTQETSARIGPLCPLKRQLFVAPREFGPLLRRQLRLRDDNLALEPCGRNTAPAIGLAAAYLSRRDPDATMVVLPADHLIERRAAFIQAVRLAEKLAGRGLLVTFGITPDRPDTGYGYIQSGDRICRTGRMSAHRVLGFREKPDAATARKHLAAGNYVWNSGMFVWRASAILDAFGRYLPDFRVALDDFSAAIGTRRERHALDDLYRRAPSISIDYAVMERAENIAAVIGRFDWDDVGSWLALERHIKPDRGGNITRGQCIAKDASGCIVDTDTGAVALLGVADLVVVRSGDAVLVADRQALGGIRELLAKVAQKKETQGLL